MHQASVPGNCLSLCGQWVKPAGLPTRAHVVPSPVAGDGWLRARSTLAFVFSRLRCVDELAERGKRRMHNLSFEDFLEALVRFAYRKALPTGAEMQERGSAHAGEFLADLADEPEAEAATAAAAASVAVITK